jgi:hypothetical protein
MDSDLNPACWSWPIPEEIPEPFSESEVATLPPSIRVLVPSIRKLLASCPVELRRQTAFHDGQCARCGRKDTLVEDHDHTTGLFRGWLCRSCNTSEGVSSHPVFVKYRQRNPATILGATWEYIDPITKLPPRKRLEIEIDPDASLLNGNAVTSLGL